MPIPSLLRSLTPYKSRFSAAQWEIVVYLLKRHDHIGYGTWEPASFITSPRPRLRYDVWNFELLEILATGTCCLPVLARKRRWNPDLCNQHGAFETSALAADNFYVADYREVGYCGPIGAVGAAEMRNPGTAGMPRTYDDGENGLHWLGTIVDLECPPGQEVDCTDYGTCDTGGTGGT